MKHPYDVYGSGGGPFTPTPEQRQLPLGHIPPKFTLSFNSWPSAEGEILVKEGKLGHVGFGGICTSLQVSSVSHFCLCRSHRPEGTSSEAHGLCRSSPIKCSKWLMEIWGCV